MSSRTPVRFLRQMGLNIYRSLDRLYVSADKHHIRRTKSIRLIPNANHCRGGKLSYAEWAHVIGVFQTLIFIHLDNKVSNQVLDVGCGTGLLAMASEPFIGESGGYTGIDVSRVDINFCRQHYPATSFEFIHFDVSNPAYAPEQGKTKLQWSVASDSFDLVTALSVWTHLDEADALFYMQEVYRVLKPGGKAIITFFRLDELYERSLNKRTKEQGKYDMTSQEKWIFNQSAYGSDAWFCPKWVKVPEDAIAITDAGFSRLISTSKLKLVQYYHGSWKQVPGPYFQDVVVFEKSAE